MIDSIQMKPATPDPVWYCLRTRTRMEKNAAVRLRSDLQIEVFCPCVRFERVRRSGKAWVREALFPGYLFARFPFAESFRQVQTSHGISTIVAFGGCPAVIPDAVIQTLRESVTDEETIEIQNPVKAGEEVQVVEGIFRGLRAVVTRVMPARQRVAVLVELLGEIREVELAEQAVLSDALHPLIKGTA
jgi:transcriptional antiterminator RfaH